MIQRIQSLYLLLTSLLSLLFLNGSYLKFFNKSGYEVFMNFRGIWESSGTTDPEKIKSLIPLFVMMIIIFVLSLSAIFFFKKRRIQLKLTLAIILLSIVVIGLILFYAVWITKKYQAVLAPGFKMFVPLLILIFATLALRGIKKDENRVRSYDRLR